MYERKKTLFLLIIIFIFNIYYIYTAELVSPLVSITRSAINVKIELKDAFDIYKDFNTKYREIEKGKKVNLIYYIRLYKRTWFLFFPTEEEVPVYSSNYSKDVNEIVIKREIQYTYALKIFEIIQTDNISKDVEKEIIYYKDPLKETLLKIKNVFFEKKFKYDIPLSKLKLSNKYDYFVKLKVDFVAVENESPFNSSVINFSTKWRKSSKFRIR